MTSMTPADLEQLVEGHDLEAKLAAGRDGRGELPASFFETCSAFANTDGGVVILGVEELQDGKLVTKGITEPAKVVRALWYLHCGPYPDLSPASPPPHRRYEMEALRAASPDRTRPSSVPPQCC